MISTYNVGEINWEPWEWILVPGLIIIIYFLGARYKAKKIGSNPEYKYFLTALLLKIGAGLFFGIIYVFYYGGGDTISYYSSAIPLSRLFWETPLEYFDIIFNSTQITEDYSKMEWEAYTFNVFTNSTGIPLSFISHDPKAFMVSKLTSPFLILTGNSYFATTILIATITFIPLWMLFRTILKLFPVLTKELAISILFVPSVLFWGSGIMKDTYTMAATSLSVVCFFLLTRKDRKNYMTAVYFIGLVVTYFFILSIKPYILNILVPCQGLWFGLIVLRKINNPIFKFIVVPIVFVIGLGGSLYVLRSLSSSMDKFALDQALETAQVTQEDMLREEQYGSNNFDIGEIDGSIPNLVSKMPIATFAGLFRPSILEARSPVMLLSALENLALLSLLIFTLYRVKLSLIYQLIKTTPFLLFCFTFSFLFAFMLGITTPNFGALVRFKIPLMPFFCSGLYVLYSTRKIIGQQD